MNFKITDKILCLPPYLSTTWDQVAFIHTEKPEETGDLILVINLIDGRGIFIPDLDSSIIDIIFSSHVAYIEKKSKAAKESKSQTPQAHFFQNVLGLSPEQISQLSIKLSPGSSFGGFEEMESAMLHDPTKAHMPDLPIEMLDKIVQVVRILTGGEINNFPKAEPHCNCLHCQLSRAVHQEKKEEHSNQEQKEEIISDEELKFKDWEIKQIGDRLFRVTSPLDPSIKYDVFLGTPIGCTCGQADCEHIKAVLLS